MNNKKGFVMYELLITYSLTFVIILSIFTSITSLSKKLVELYKKDSIEANQLLVYRSIGNDFAYYNINNIKKCTGLDNCTTIVYEDKNSNLLYKNLVITNNSITYDNIKTTFKYATINISNSLISNIDTGGAGYLGRMIKLYIPISYNNQNYNITLFCTNGINIKNNFPDTNLNNIFN